MVFSSITFLCFFLPIAIIGYYLLPSRCRNIWLLIVSLFFYAWGEPKYIWIMLFSTVFDYTNGRLLEKFEGKTRVRRLVLILSLVVNLGLLAFYKYSGFASTLPIGISFYTFQTLSYTIDVYRNKVKVQHNIIDFGMYICLFPQLIAGPIVRYADIEKEISGREECLDLLWAGSCRFIVGLGKKVIFANQIGSLWTEISSQGTLIGWQTAWIGAVAFMFQIYFDFSGYSDMAIGLGQIFGFHFPDNFRYPYTAKSITDFWRRWHITLSTWFREYVYIPLGGNRCGKKRQVINLLIVWSLTGIWHGAGWNFLFWGLYYFVFLVLEKMILAKYMDKWPVWLQHGYALIVILVGWVIFACDNTAMLKNYFVSLFGGNGSSLEQMLYYVKSYGILFLILVIASTTLPVKLKDWILKEKLKNAKVEFVLTSVFLFAVLALCFVFLVGDSYNPFLYFRF